MDEMLKELQETFFGEADQLLEDLESSLMTLETEGFEEELVNKIFRLAHNFKGSSRSVGFLEPANLAHRAEDLLTKIKNKQVAVTSELTGALLRTTDALKTSLSDLKQNRGSTSDFTDLIQTLESFMNSPSKSEPTSAPTDQGFTLFDEPATIEPKPEPSAAALSKQPKETQSKAPSPSKAEDDQLRISAKKLDHLLNLVGELVVNQTILQELTHRTGQPSVKSQQLVSSISKIVSDIQSVTMALRLIPVKPLFQKLRRAVRDVASELGKDIEYLDEGEHVELDKTVVDRMIDPLTHMVRNAVDHGVENEQDRLSSGKPKKAKITLSAASHDDRVVITLRDDGKGLNKSKILAKAVEKGLVSQNEATTLSDDEIHNLIFRPGFSTKEAVSTISGRGVGMEVVQKAIDELKGVIQIETAEGKGSTFRISLPLSLSIIGGMVVRVQEQAYVIPISQLLETIELGKMKPETSTGRGTMVQLREEVLPVYHLSAALKLKGKQRSTTLKRPALVTIFEGRKVSFEVDEIVGQQQVVLKKLGREFEGLPGLMGGAVLSSGDPGIVLSLYELIKKGSIHAA